MILISANYKACEWGEVGNGCVILVVAQSDKKHALRVKSGCRTAAKCPAEITVKT
jgi:hypothetical protein